MSNFAPGKIGNGMTVISAKKVKIPKAKEHVDLCGGLQLQLHRKFTLNLKSVPTTMLRGGSCATAGRGQETTLSHTKETRSSCVTSLADRCLQDCMECGRGSWTRLEGMTSVLAEGWRPGYSAQLALEEALGTGSVAI